MALSFLNSRPAVRTSLFSRPQNLGNGLHCDQHVPHHAAFISACPPCAARRSQSGAAAVTARRQGRCAAASIAAPAAAAAASSFALVNPHAAFTFATVLMVPLYLLATAFPHSKLTRALVQSPAVFGGLALLYAALLVQCCLSGGGLPEALRHIADVTLLRLPLAASSIWHSLPNAGLEAVSALFRSPGITALAWVHLLLLDFFLAREVMLDGLRTSVFTAHSVLLCFFVGPLGLLSHLITSTATRAMRPRHA